MEQISEDRIAVDPERLTHELSARIVTPGALTGQERTVDHGGGYPIGIDEPRDCPDVPEHLGASEVIREVLGIDVRQVVGDRPGAPYEPLDLGLSGAQVLGDVAARDVNKRHAAVEQDM